MVVVGVGIGCGHLMRVRGVRRGGVGLNYTHTLGGSNLVSEDCGHNVSLQLLSVLFSYERVNVLVRLLLVCQECRVCDVSGEQQCLFVHHGFSFPHATTQHNSDTLRVLC